MKKKPSARIEEIRKELINNVELEGLRVHENMLIAIHIQSIVQFLDEQAGEGKE